MLEVKRPKSWLKSVSAFANGEGGSLIFGISNDDQIVGLADAEGDAKKMSEDIKTKLDPIPAVNLEHKEVDGKKLPNRQYPPLPASAPHVAKLWYPIKCLRDAVRITVNKKAGTNRRIPAFFVISRYKTQPLEVLYHFA
ncbi:MAG: putative DNA binding domain-containing protein [Parabacteroides sp.]|nr:putative DNA binding domain-containing protein [Parabacteroides sp.]